MTMNTKNLVLGNSPLCFAKLSLVLMFSAFASCVDEYDEVPDGYSNPMLVVDGNIYSNQECCFSLSHTVELNGSYLDAIEGVDNATITVCGSRGETWECISSMSGKYNIPVGELSADAEYWVEIDAPGYGHFKSTPMKPLAAPELVSLTFEAPADGEEGNVYFLVTTSDMSTGVKNDKSYLLWRYEECYVLESPVRTSYYYNPATDAIEVLPTMLYHGWREVKPKERIILSNESFDYGAITNYCIYHKENQDYRFMQRYRTCVYQEAITAEEYEYRHLLATQTSEMGGLFTPMPTELPSNVRGVNGEKAIGFVGVRSSVSSKVLYVNRKEVRYHFYPQYKTFTLTDSRLDMYKSGYRVSSYNPYTGDEEWALRWVVDVTDPYWNASLTKPDYWEDAPID